MMLKYYPRHLGKLAGLAVSSGGAVASNGETLYCNSNPKC